MYLVDATVTFRSQPGGIVRTVAGLAPTARQLVESERAKLAAQFPGETWRVQCLSTPNSIYQDLVLDHSDPHTIAHHAGAARQAERW